MGVSDFVISVTGFPPSLGLRIVIYCQLFVLDHVCTLSYNKSEFVLYVKTVYDVSVILTPISRFTLFGQCFLVYDILQGSLQFKYLCF